MAQLNVQQAFDLALRQHQSGRLQEAWGIYQQILVQEPNHADALHHLGVIAHQMGRHDLAVDLIGRALGADPGNARACNNLGAALEASGRLDEAIAAYRQALAIDPNSPETHRNVGVALQKKGQLDEAIAAYRTAAALNPNYAEAHCNLGAALQTSGQPDDAAAACRRAIGLRPDYAEAHSNLAVALQKMGQLDEAMAACRRALAIRPDYPEALMNMGVICQELGEFGEAIRCYDRAILLRPDYAQAHTNRGIVHLLLGNFKPGWTEYEWRRARHDPERCSDAAGTWDGGELAGKSILLQHEQGLGDAFQFIRYAQQLKARGATVVVQCPSSLREILRRTPGIDRFVLGGESVPMCDLCVPLLSLPGLFRTDLESIPRRAPYVFGDPALVSEWKQRMAELPGFRVGIVWQGNPKLDRDRGRSIPLRAFAPLAAVTGVTLVSLQKQFGVEQIEGLSGLFAVKDYQGVGEEADGFLRTAAIIANLDLVISADTAVAHLSGAMGVPVWTALRTSPDWRWLLQREDTPWYPSMRLFRQTERGDWGEVFTRMAGALRLEVNRAGRSR